MPNAAPAAAAASKDFKKLEFGRGDVENVLARLSPAQIDDLPFGAIQLDSTGKVMLYNLTEGGITGRKAADMVGKNFFKEIAPCCNRPEFKGRFDEIVRNPSLDVQFNYVFDYRMNPTKVQVHLKKAVTGDAFWVLVRRT